MYIRNCCVRFCPILLNRVEFHFRSQVLKRKKLLETAHRKSLNFPEVSKKTKFGIARGLQWVILTLTGPLLVSYTVNIWVFMQHFKGDCGFEMVAKIIFIFAIPTPIVQNRKVWLWAGSRPLSNYNRVWVGTVCKRESALAGVDVTLLCVLHHTHYSCPTITQVPTTQASLTLVM